MFNVIQWNPHSCFDHPFRYKGNKVKPMFIAKHKHDPQLVWGHVYDSLVHNKCVALINRGKYYMCNVFITHLGEACTVCID